MDGLIRLPMSASVMVTLQNVRSENHFFAVNLPSMLFSATIANANIKSQKFLHTLFDTYLDYMLVNKIIWPESYTILNFLPKEKNKRTF